MFKPCMPGVRCQCGSSKETGTMVRCVRCCYKQHFCCVVRGMPANERIKGFGGHCCFYCRPSVTPVPPLTVVPPSPPSSTLRDSPSPKKQARRETSCDHQDARPLSDLSATVDCQSPAVAPIVTPSSSPAINQKQDLPPPPPLPNVVQQEMRHGITRLLAQALTNQIDKLDTDNDKDRVIGPLLMSLDQLARIPVDNGIDNKILRRNHPSRGVLLATPIGKRGKTRNSNPMILLQGRIDVRRSTAPTIPACHAFPGVNLIINTLRHARDTSDAHTSLPILSEMRYSCTPTAQLVTIVPTDESRLCLALVPYRSMKASEEITVQWPWHEHTLLQSSYDAWENKQKPKEVLKHADTTELKQIYTILNRWQQFFAPCACLHRRDSKCFLAWATSYVKLKYQSRLFAQLPTIRPDPANSPLPLSIIGLTPRSSPGSTMSTPTLSTVSDASSNTSPNPNAQDTITTHTPHDDAPLFTMDPIVLLTQTIDACSHLSEMTIKHAESLPLVSTLAHEPTKLANARLVTSDTSHASPPSDPRPILQLTPAQTTRLRHALMPTNLEMHMSRKRKNPSS
ncbi:hypothetical protein BC940DRAFT_351090 [Gongronella butleri]|nr:hypothetical protein BC940DRAFT_351090 [Gongronella butleri]